MAVSDGFFPRAEPRRGEPIARVVLEVFASVLRRPEFIFGALFRAGSGRTGLAGMVPGNPVVSSPGVRISTSMVSLSTAPAGRQVSLYTYPVKLSDSSPLAPLGRGV